MLDFIKKHPSVTTSIVGVSIIILTILNKELAKCGASLLVIAVLGCLIYWYIGILLVVLFFAFNIAAHNAVVNKNDSGIIFALLFGGFGAILGLYENPNYFNKNAVKIIFNIQLWFVIWLFASYRIYFL